MIMDIIVVAIFALTVFFSMRKGFMFTLAFFTRGIASLVVAYFLSPTLGGIVEKTELGETTKMRIAEQLTEKWQDSELYQALPTIFRGDADTMTQDLIENTSSSLNHLAWVVLSFIVIVIVKNRNYFPESTLYFLKIFLLFIISTACWKVSSLSRKTR